MNPKTIGLVLVLINVQVAAQVPQVQQDDAKCKALGGIRIGINKQEFLTCFPPPYNINKTQTANGTREQYIYPLPGGRNAYVYFENDILTALQNFY